MIVETLGSPVAGRRIELVERKGLGHPDSICDALADAAGLALARLYLDTVGTVAHYNLDKALLVAGQCPKDFGRGTLTRPMELILGDRATFEVAGRRLPVEDTVRAAVDGWIAAHLPGVRPGQDLEVRCAMSPGSAELRSIFGGTPGPVPANDTSGASGYAPLSPTERLVLDTERFLNGPEFKTRFPDTGQDVKVFAFRQDEHVAMTVAMPFRCQAIDSEATYFRRKEEALAALSARFAGTGLAVEWALNTLDRRGAGADGTYLTLTGTSAEDADSGQVGRGNRANGLIPFSRPTSGEAVAGKNAVAHVGKIYSLLTDHLAHQLHARCPGLREVYVHLAVRIGQPADRPWCGVQACLADGVTLAEVEPHIRDVLEAELARLPEFRARLLRGELSGAA